MRSFVRLTVSLVAALSLAALVGCKQSEGERCQIDDDCEGDLICSTNNKCQSRVSATTPDASPADGPVAPPPDAAPSAPDAAPPDAAPVDAAPSDA